jgi:hypothetical protein
MRITSTSKFAIAAALSLAIGAVPENAQGGSRIITAQPPINTAGATSATRTRIPTVTPMQRMPIVDTPGTSRAIVSNKPGNSLGDLNDPKVVDQVVEVVKTPGGETAKTDKPGNSLGDLNDPKVVDQVVEVVKTPGGETDKPGQDDGPPLDNVEDVVEADKQGSDGAEAEKDEPIDDIDVVEADKDEPGNNEPGQDEGAPLDELEDMFDDIPPPVGGELDEIDVVDGIVADDPPALANGSTETTELLRPCYAAGVEVASSQNQEDGGDLDHVPATSEIPCSDSGSSFVPFTESASAR